MRKQELERPLLHLRLPIDFYFVSPKGFLISLSCISTVKQHVFNAPGNQPSLLLVVSLIYTDARPVWTCAGGSVAAVLTCFS